MATVGTPGSPFTSYADLGKSVLHVLIYITVIVIVSISLGCGEDIIDQFM